MLDPLRPLLLVGAGGLARETLELVRALNRQTPTWEVMGLLDDDPSLHGREVHGVTVTGPTDAVEDHPEAFVTICVASPDDPVRRLGLTARLGLQPERYATLVHPAATVPESGSIGPGSVIHAGSVLTADVTLGEHVIAMPAVVLTHDDVVEAGVTFGAGALVSGGVTIERGAYIGAGARLRERIRIGAGALVGMGTVVTRSVPPGEVWAGVPARRIR
jgi:sugar O-acyltransferase (sialic acid O-acetyltransferase NeuD family)